MTMLGYVICTYVLMRDSFIKLLKELFSLFMVTDFCVCKSCREDFFFWYVFIFISTNSVYLSKLSVTYTKTKIASIFMYSLLFDKLLALFLFYGKKRRIQMPNLHRKSIIRWKTNDFCSELEIYAYDNLTGSSLIGPFRYLSAKDTRNKNIYF